MATVTLHNQYRITDLLQRWRGLTTGGTPGVTSWRIAAELDISVDTARRNLRALSLAQRVDVRDNPLGRGYLYSLPPTP